MRTFSTLRCLPGLAFLLLFSACDPTPEAQEGPENDTTVATAPDSFTTLRVQDGIPYRKGESDAWKLDLALPENTSGKKRPAIVLIHGGGWRAGSKQDPIFRALLLDYAMQGYVTLSVEYRLHQEAPFPACVEDVKCAVRWLRVHAEEYNVDPDRIGAYGHSAGAHLALMLAMCPPSAGLEGDGGWNEYSSMVNAVVGGSAPTEWGARLTDWAKPEWWPIGYIRADTPPMLLIQGGEDPIVKATLVDDFVEKMKAAGAEDVNYIKIDDADHGVAYLGKLDVTRPAMDDFFARTLKHDPSLASNR